MTKTIKLLTLPALAGLLILAACGENIVPGYPVPEDAPVWDMFPDASTVREREVKPFIYYEARAGKKVIGFAFPTSNLGYNGQIRSLTAMNPLGVIIATTVLSHTETPAWWELIPETWFDQFIGIEIGKVDVSGEDFLDYQIDGVSEATVTTETIIDNIWDAFKVYRVLKPS